MHHAGRRHKHLLRNIVLPHEVFQVFITERFNAFFSAEDWRAERVTGKRAEVKLLENQLFRGVVDAADLFNNHLFFFFNLFRRKNRVADKIGEKVERGFKVFGQTAQVDAGLLFCCIGIEIAAVFFNISGDVDVGAPLCAFKESVFNEMCQSRRIAGVIARTGIDLYAEGNAFYRGYGIGDNPQSVSQNTLHN